MNIFLYLVLYHGLGTEELNPSKYIGAYAVSYMAAVALNFLKIVTSFVFKRL
jgi:hypothetical protein